jgi:hypothetical protein
VDKTFTCQCFVHLHVHRGHCKQYAKETYRGVGEREGVGIYMLGGEGVYGNRGLWRSPLLLFKISKNLKKISYQPRRNLLQPQIVKNLLPKWSVFVRIFYKNNSIFFLFCSRYLLNLLILLTLLRFSNVPMQ